MPSAETLGHVVAAKVATGELGIRLGLSDEDLAVVTRVLAAGAHGWRAFECETLAADGTYVGTVRMTTHPAVGASADDPGAADAPAEIVARDPGEDDAIPRTASRRARPKRTPAQLRVREALARAKSNRASRKGHSGTGDETLENPPESADSPATANT